LDAAQLQRVRSRSREREIKISLDPAPERTRRLGLLPAIMKCVHASFVASAHWSKRLDQLGREVAAMLKSGDYHVDDVISSLKLAAEVVPEWCTVAKSGRAPPCFKVINKSGLDAAIKIINATAAPPTTPLPSPSTTSTPTTPTAVPSSTTDFKRSLSARVAANKQ
jgi:hypothetical protein